MALEEPLETDVVSREGGLTLMASPEVRQRIDQAGGLSIDYQRGAFGTGLVVRLNGGGCGCS